MTKLRKCFWFCNFLLFFFSSVGKIQALLVFSFGFVRLENQMCLNVRWVLG